MKIHNFGAGPAILPESVYDQASNAIKNFNRSGLSLLEISHRSDHFSAIIKETEALFRELLNINDDYHIMFLAGGASQHFAQIPMNFLDKSSQAAYLDTGVWASNAIKEAEHFGKIYISASGLKDDYNSIPTDILIPDNCLYFHYTSNNTIYGTCLFEPPKTSIPVICDMSSDILSAEIDITKFDLIYGSVQKNAGPAGVSFVIIKNTMFEKIKKDIPNIFNYSVLASRGSLYNTPPVFSIFGTLLNLRWLKGQGGIKEIERRNIEKCSLLYREIERNSLFVPRVADWQRRSRMNVTFFLKNPDLESDFLEFASVRNITGIKQYQGFNGFRASLYNAMPIESVNVLVLAMRQYEEYIIG